MHDRSALGACGLVVAGLALAALAAHPRPAPTTATVAANVTGADGSGAANVRGRPRGGARVVAAPGEPDVDATRPGPRQLEALRDGGRLDLNAAGAAEFELLPGIGPALARRIVEDRTTRGVFRTVEELERVRGIGPATLARLQKLVTTAPMAWVSDRTGTPRPAPP